MRLAGTSKTIFTQRQHDHLSRESTKKLLDFKKLNTELPHDPVIPLLGINSKEWKTGTQANTFTHVHNSSTIHQSQKREIAHVTING